MLESLIIDYKFKCDLCKLNVRITNKPLTDVSQDIITTCEHEVYNSRDKAPQNRYINPKKRRWE